MINNTTKTNTTCYELWCCSTIKSPLRHILMLGIHGWKCLVLAQAIHYISIYFYINYIIILFFISPWNEIMKLLRNVREPYSSFSYTKVRVGGIYLHSLTLFHQSRIQIIILSPPTPIKIRKSVRPVKLFRGYHWNTAEVYDNRRAGVVLIQLLHDCLWTWAVDFP